MRPLFLFLLVTASIVPGGCRSPLQARPPGSPAGAAKADSTAADSAGAGRVAVLPVPDLGYNAREGRAVYRHYCLNCHGEAGAGDGFNAYNLDPRPRALADSVFQASHSDQELAAAIRSGGGAVGLSTGMPPWGRTLNERKIKNTVEYLRTFRTKAKDPR